MSNVFIKKRIDAKRLENIVASTHGELIFRNGDLVVEMKMLLDEESVENARDLIPDNNDIPLVIVEEIGNANDSYEGTFNVMERRHRRRRNRLATLSLELLSKAGKWKRLKRRRLILKI